MREKVEEKMKDRAKGLLLIPAILFTLSVPFMDKSMAQKSHRPSKDEIQEITRQELERYRTLYGIEHERWAREYEVRKHTEMQLEALRAAVARAARL